MLSRPLDRPLWEPLHRDLDRVGGDDGGGGDPLSGLSILSRVSSEDEFYQDSAATIPATEDGDPVEAWKRPGMTTFALSGGVAFVLRIESGKRFIETSGNSVLGATIPRPFPFWIAMGVKHTGSSLRGASGYGAGNVALGALNGNLAPPDDAFWAWTPDGGGSTYGQTGNFDTNWHVHILECPSADETTWRMWLDGVLTGSAALTSGTPVATATACFIGSDGNGANMVGGITSHVQGDATEPLTDDQVARINDFLTSQLPVDGLMAMAGSEEELAGDDEISAGAEILS